MLGGILGLFGFYVALYAVILLFWVADYVFKAIGMHTIAKRMGKENAFLAWIPFARTYLHGELAGEIGLKTKRIKRPGLWMLLLPIIFMGVIYTLSFMLIFAIVFAAMVNPLGAIGGMMGFYLFLFLLLYAYMMFYYPLHALVNFQIFEGFTTRNMTIVHSVLAVFIPLYEALLFFRMRNKAYAVSEPVAETVAAANASAEAVAQNETE